MLKVTDLEHYYGGSHVLRSISFDVPDRACTVIMGRNGVGKTTLLKCLTGVLLPRSGRIEFDGEDITRLTSYERARRGIAYVPQGREIFPRLTVRENLQMGLANQGGRGGVPDEIFDMFPVLRGMLERRGGDLSGGQQQQLAIGRALAMRPKLLILDEPTEGIQPSIIKDIERAISQLSAGGRMSILLVEQYLDFATSLADSFAVMSRGAIVTRGARADLDRESVARLMV